MKEVELLAQELELLMELLMKTKSARSWVLLSELPTEVKLLAQACFAVIQCLERRPYGNIILLKGCVGPDGLDLKPETVVNNLA